MAQLEVQPKKKSQVIWIIATVIILIALFSLFRTCSETKTNGGSDTSVKDSVAINHSN
jgi:ABC-type cobalt transport system substrate-binding protein